jgi:Domain of unknown function (DUF4158)
LWKSKSEVSTQVVKEIPFLFFAPHFPGRIDFPAAFPTLCKPKTSASAYFGKLRCNQTRRLSHGENVSPVSILLFSRGNGRAFLLTPAELQLVLTCRGDANRCGMALLLKTICHLGYVLDPMPQIPEEVRAFIAAQLGLLWDSSESYSWDGSTLDYHLAQIRQHTGWRFPTRRSPVRWWEQYSLGG